MISELSKAREEAKKALEILYEDTCTVTEKNKVKNPTTKLTEFKEVEVVKDVPCKLSFSTIKSTEEKENVAAVNQVVKLFVSPSIEISPGSKITVVHLGKAIEYSSSGQEATFYTHKEIVLNLFKEYA